MGVVIVGSRADPHVQRVASKIEQNTSVVVLDMGVGTSASGIDYIYDVSGRRLRVHDALASIEQTEICAVWWRLKPAFDVMAMEGMSRRRSEFAAREWRHVLEPLSAHLPGVRWLNPRPAEHKIRYKTVQLELAASVGLSIPETLVSNNPAAIAAFVERYDRCIYKPLTWYIEPPDQILFTTEISRETVSTEGASLAVAPGIFQRLVSKSYELRITIVKQDIFAAKIDSQATAKTSLDWRIDQLSVPAESTLLPTLLESKLRAFHERAGLVMGVYDFIVDKDGRYLFLEVNPAGQWLWLEDRLSTTITDCVANYLAVGA